MYDIVNNVNTIGEILPLIDQTLHFRFTARDNRVGGGGVNSAIYVVNVTSEAGPFLVSAPNTRVAWLAGENQTVTWNVANTTAAPVSCSDVSLDLSIDGGYTYPISLLASTPNDGSQEISVPSLATTTARIRVACLTNIFFDISDADFSIQETVGEPCRVFMPTLLK
jgi:subtilase family serine protease